MEVNTILKPSGLGLKSPFGIDLETKRKRLDQNKGPEAADLTLLLFDHPSPVLLFKIRYDTTGQPALLRHFHAGFIFPSLNLCLNLLCIIIAGGNCKENLTPALIKEHLEGGYRQSSPHIIQSKNEWKMFIRSGRESLDDDDPCSSHPMEAITLKTIQLVEAKIMSDWHLVYTKIGKQVVVRVCGYNKLSFTLQARLNSRQLLPIFQSDARGRRFNTDDKIQAAAE
ncbi:hypothetical protein J6590_055306 [Homalodisca vitripennis]|nr:hypothetical protein J6590_055306 [Homalodisca vitripennis]